MPDYRDPLPALDRPRPAGNFAASRIAQMCGSEQRTNQLPKKKLAQVRTESGNSGTSDREKHLPFAKRYIVKCTDTESAVRLLRTENQEHKVAKRLLCK
jgi:hypothetical protein